jgi:hypothetical protein
VQLNAKSAPAKGSHYAIVVSAGKKKVSATGISGEKLTGGGVALKVDVGAGLNITGQVAAETGGTAPMGKNGKPMVWIPKMLGSSIGPHWAESDSAEAAAAKTSGHVRTDTVQKMQEHQDQPASGR